MKRNCLYIVFSLLFGTLALAQSTQTRLNGFPPATTRISSTQVQFKGNLGESFGGTITNLAGQKILTGTWRQATRMRVITDVDEKPTPSLPHEFWLAQNYPNPFNPTTVIPFSLDQQGFGELVILNLLGQTVRKLDLSGYSAGAHYLNWDGRDDSGQLVSSGPLFFRLTTEKHTALHRMLLLK